MSIAVCDPCCVVNVPTIDDTQSVLMFFAQQDFSFVVNCPPGFNCVSNQTITHGKIPPIIYPQQGSTMQLQGCQSLISIKVPPGTFGPALQAIANQVFALWAQQQAICNSIIGIPPQFPPPTRNGSSINKSPQVCAGSPFSDTLTWPNHSGPFTMSLASGTLPAGLTFSQSTDTNTGFLSGTPSTPGTYNFTVTITDVNSDTLSIFYVFNVMGLTNLTSLPPAAEMRAYSFQLNAVGGVAPYTFALTSGSPPGITLSSSGLLIGTPNYVTAGSYPITVQVTDSTARSCSQNATLIVTLAPGPDWTQLVWDTFTLSQGNQTPPPSSATGNAIKNIVFGTLHYANGSNPFPTIGPVHAGTVNYTGPSVTSRVIMTITVTGNSPCGGAFRAISTQGGAIGIFNQNFTSGTFAFNFTIPISAGANITVDSIGAQLLQFSQLGTSGDMSFTMAIVNV